MIRESRLESEIYGIIAQAHRKAGRRSYYRGIAAGMVFGALMSLTVSSTVAWLDAAQEYEKVGHELRRCAPHVERSLYSDPFID